MLDLCLLGLVNILLDNVFLIHTLISHLFHNQTLFCKANVFRHSFFIRSPFLWNTLPFDLANTSSYHTFNYKSNVSSYFYVHTFYEFESWLFWYQLQLLNEGEVNITQTCSL